MPSRPRIVTLSLFRLPLFTLCFFSFASLATSENTLRVPHSTDKPWKVGERACLNRNETDRRCGTVTAVDAQGATVKLEIESEGVVVGGGKAKKKARAAAAAAAKAAKAATAKKAAKKAARRASAAPPKAKPTPDAREAKEAPAPEPEPAREPVAREATSRESTPREAAAREREAALRETPPPAATSTPTRAEAAAARAAKKAAEAAAEAPPRTPANTTSTLSTPAKPRSATIPWYDHFYLLAQAAARGSQTTIGPQLAWGPTLALNDRFAVRANLAASIFRSSTGNLFTVGEYTILGSMLIAGGVALEIGGGGQTWIGQGGTSVLLNANLSRHFNGALGPVETILAGYSVFLITPPTHQLRLGLGFSF